MINLPGNLYIRSVHGRDGDYSVGRLVTDIGEFVLRDALLGQYEEGHYEGEFGIAEIFPASYVAGGRMVIEIRATLASLVLAAIEDLHGGPADSVALADSGPVEPEKGEDTSQVIAPNNGQPAENDGMHDGQPAQDEIFPATGDAGDDGADLHLFGTLWPLGDAVRLDTSVSRAVFRQQKERMKALGYAFQASGQLWVRA
ncbi:hypothetical protein PLCT1_02392 [Planctomycetaceae bacterium]|nr:hypothetical protein PLCT1_02392 [Planctomycetaceae bacterium]